MSAVDNMSRARAPSGAVVLIEAIFAAVVVVSFVVFDTLQWICRASWQGCFTFASWLLSFLASVAVLLTVQAFTPVFAGISALTGLIMVLTAGVGIRVAGQIAYNNAGTFRAAFLQLTHQQPSLLERELNRPRRQPITIEGRADHAE